MTTFDQSPPASSESSPEIYQAQTAGNTANVNHQGSNKNTYRHIPGHQQMNNNSVSTYQQFTHGMHGANGYQYPTAVAGPLDMHNGQYYPAMSGPNHNYMPVYNGAAQDHSYYYYGPNRWAIQGPVPIYHPHSYSNSPPSTPPQSQMPYGYQMFPPNVDYFQENRLLPPSPPQVTYTGANATVGTHAIPPLDHRRNSWSSSGASDSPATPFMPSVSMDPAIVGEPHAAYAASYAEQHEKSIDSSMRNVECLLKAGPEIPRPIPAVYSPEFTKTMGQSLENPTNTTNVYIRGLPPDTDDDKLYEMTCRFGTVTSHKAIMDTEHDTCKGYGFARYDTKEQAENCIRGLVSLKYEAGFARESFNARLKTLADPNSTNIYVSNLPRTMNEKDMQDIFAGFVVVSNRILRDVNGNSRGVGFARFESRDICDDIIKNFHGMPVGEERLPLQVRYADTSAQKRLKATTTKKRQFRTNEYNNVVSGYSYVQPQIQAPMTQFRNRVWLRQNSTLSNMSSDAGVALSSHDQTSPQTPTRKTWDRSQDWKGNGEENHPQEWKQMAWRNGPVRNGVSTSEKSVKLETVPENGDSGDTVSETQSEVTTVPTVLDYCVTAGSVGRASVGSFSDPGDSYGGRELSADEDD